MAKVSVNIVTRNRAELLKRALYSVRNQSYKDFEIVVVDDGSTDNTREVVNEFLESEKNVIYFKFNESVGVVKARQKALELSKGEFVAVIDDDDEWIMSNKLEKQIAVLEGDSRVVLVGCRGESIDAVTEKINFWEPPVTDTEIRKVMLLRNCFMHPAMVFRRKDAIAVGGYSERYKYAEDYALVLRLGSVGKMEIIPERLIRFRVGHSGLTKVNNLEQIKAGKSLIYEFRKVYPGYFVSMLKWSLHYFVVKFFGQSVWMKLKELVNYENAS